MEINECCACKLMLVEEFLHYVMRGRGLKWPRGRALSNINVSSTQFASSILQLTKLAQPRFRMTVRNMYKYFHEDIVNFQIFLSTFARRIFLDASDEKTLDSPRLHCLFGFAGEAAVVFMEEKNYGGVDYIADLLVDFIVSDRPGILFDEDRIWEFGYSLTELEDKQKQERQQAEQYAERLDEMIEDQTKLELSSDTQESKRISANVTKILQLHALYSQQHKGLLQEMDAEVFEEIDILEEELDELQRKICVLERDLGMDD